MALDGTASHGKASFDGKVVVGSALASVLISIPGTSSRAC
jgi:hypothetical protein